MKYSEYSEALMKWWLLISMDICDDLILISILFQRLLMSDIEVYGSCSLTSFDWWYIYLFIYYFSQWNIGRYLQYYIRLSSLAAVASSAASQASSSGWLFWLAIQLKMAWRNAMASLTINGSYSGCGFRCYSQRLRLRRMYRGWLAAWL